MQRFKYKIVPTTRFKRDIKTLKKRDAELSLLNEVIATLASGKTLPAKHKDHALKGSRSGYRDCHILDDWVLIYKIDKGALILLLSETGTHSDLFRK